jgi:hypothetical protein
MSDLVESIYRLHGFLAQRVRLGRLIGPDPGVRFNYRIGRFAKGALPFVPWNDELCYVQAQGYWTLSNWLLFDHTDDELYRDAALACARSIMAQQREDGAWDYPNPEWRGRVATTEGNWGAIGLLESYRRTREAPFLEAALRWHRYLVDGIGFQSLNNDEGDEFAVNYFAGDRRERVCNNSATVLRLLAEFADATGDPRYLHLLRHRAANFRTRCGAKREAATGPTSSAFSTTRSSA